MPDTFLPVPSYHPLLRLEAMALLIGMCVTASAEVRPGKPAGLDQPSAAAVAPCPPATDKTRPGTLAPPGGDKEDPGRLVPPGGKPRPNCNDGTPPTTPAPAPSAFKPAIVPVSPVPMPTVPKPAPASTAVPSPAPASAAAAPVTAPATPVPAVSEPATARIAPHPRSAPPSAIAAPVTEKSPAATVGATPAIAAPTTTIAPAAPVAAAPAAPAPTPATVPPAVRRGEGPRVIADEPERVLRPQAALPTAAAVAKAPASGTPGEPASDLARSPASGAPGGKPAPDAKKAPAKPAFEQGQLVIFWKDRGQAAIGKQVMESEFKLKPSAENALDHLGGVLVTYKLPNHAEAVRIKMLLQARFPDWQLDFNAHYRPQGEETSGGAARPRQYVLQKIGLSATETSNARPLHIGIVDTAVAADGALRGLKIERRSFLGLADRPAPVRHGTALAALMAGADERSGFRGMAPGIKLFSAAIMRQQGEESGTTTEMLVRALDWLLGEGVRVVNLSLGGQGDAVMESAIQKLLARDVVIVAAAGNFGPDAGPSFPAAYPGVIAVTASDALDRVMPMANQGNYITLTAPGVDVWAPDANGGRYHTGTSFSAAIVTGAIALLLSEETKLSGRAVAAQLCSGARDLGTPGRDPVYGCGLLQLPETTLRSARARD